MNELLLLTRNNDDALFKLLLSEPAGSIAVTDQVSKRVLTSTSQPATAVIVDATGDKALLFSGGHFEAPTINFNIKNKPFKIVFDLLISAYPSGEGAVFSQLNPNTGAGTFAATMVGSSGKLSFYWCRDGNLGSRDFMVSAQPLPLNKYTNVVIDYSGTLVSMYFDGVLVVQKAATLIYSAELPFSIGGHYGTNQYNSKGSMKNVVVEYK